MPTCVITQVAAMFTLLNFPIILPNFINRAVCKCRYKMTRQRLHSMLRLGNVAKYQIRKKDDEPILYRL